MMLTVSSLMSRTVVTVGPDTTLHKALTLFAEHRISGAPVVAAGIVLGVVSATDLLDMEATALAAAVVSGSLNADDARERPAFWQTADEPPAAYFGEVWADPGADVPEMLRRGSDSGQDVLSGHTVSEVMSRPICWVPPEMAVRDAAAYMTRAGVHRILVLDGDRLVGVLSAVDIVRAVGESLAL
jgi:CBS domain-containing protein